MSTDQPQSSQRTPRDNFSLVSRTLRLFLFVTVCGVVLRAQAPAQPPAQNPRMPIFRSGTELVLVNVVVRDKNGNVVRGLTQDDFSVAEDDKPQTITSFDFEELDKGSATPSEPEPPAVLPKKL